jgi:hypothetical protein
MKTSGYGPDLLASYLAITSRDLTFPALKRLLPVGDETFDPLKCLMECYRM